MTIQVRLVGSAAFLFSIAQVTQLAGPSPSRMEEVVAASFAAVHDGWSADEVLLRDGLNRRFIATCQQSLPDADVATLNWTLLTLRKSGKLGIPTRRRRSDDHAPYRQAAEIAARLMEDKYTINMDRVVCDPIRREEFDQIARSLAPSTDKYLLRKAAFGLRKARRLQPELVLRVADWGRQVDVHALSDLQSSLDRIPTKPGVYLFRDPTGYLYIGESHDLRARLRQHLEESEPTALIRLLASQGIVLDQVRVEIHAFDPRSAARETRMRRAYESELIESRRPRFNIRP